MNNVSYTRMTMNAGQVKWFNMKAGYGFISVRSGEHTGKDLFVHYTSIKVSNSQYRYLIAGEYVQFDVAVPEDGKHDFHATNVTGMFSGPIMCETRREQRVEKPPRMPRLQREGSTGPDAVAPVAAAAASGATAVAEDTKGFTKVARKPRTKKPVA